MEPYNDKSEVDLIVKNCFMKMKVTFLMILLLPYLPGLMAQAGSLDYTFGNGLASWPHWPVLCSAVPAQ